MRKAHEMFVLKPITCNLSPNMHRITLLTNPDKCNLHCPLCFLNQRAGCGRKFGMGEMPFEIARAAIEKYAAERDASGKRLLQEVIPSTMGEPLLYSHFDELLELCRTLEIPLNLTTNGTFPGKWGRGDGMELLLQSCSDIKLSYLASEQFDGWKANVEKLLKVRNCLRANDASAVDDSAKCTSAETEIAEKSGGNCETVGVNGANVKKIATISLQVTLHKKNLHEVPELVEWAALIGIDRIKWNKVVLLKCLARELRESYELSDSDIASLRSQLNLSNACYEGSLFFDDSRKGDCAMGGKCGVSCPFADEIWILPNGNIDYCPNPEHRFGNYVI